MTRELIELCQSIQALGKRFENPIFCKGLVDKREIREVAKCMFYHLNPVFYNTAIPGYRHEHRTMEDFSPDRVSGH